MKKILSIVLATSLAAGFTAMSVGQDSKTQDSKAQDSKTQDSAPQDARPPRPARNGGKGEAAAGAKIGEAAPAFTLKTTDGKDWSLADAKGKVVVLEWVNPDCPVCQRVMTDGTVAASIKGCKDQFADVVYIAVNSSASSKSSLDATAAYLKDNKIDVPALLDSDGKVGKLFGARTTPHCFVIDAKGVLVYKGAINDSQTGDGKINYVVQAVSQLKKGESVSPKETKPFGCAVKY